jgi:hypothetical protein
VFFNFGFIVDASFPFNVHLDDHTGGWIGPFSVLMAQNLSVASDTNNSLIDQYVSRYVNTLATPYLQRNPNCTLFRQVDFDSYAGPEAVNNTIYKQTVVKQAEDPYKATKGTCENGNLQPMLPRFKIGFTTTNTSSTNTNSTTREHMQIEIDYKILTVPTKKDKEYSLMPSLQKRFNREDRAFHISGPYCYGNDPKRAYTIDFSFNSAQQHPTSGGMVLTKGCVQGLPCLPPAAAIGDTHNIIVYNQTRTGGSAVVDVATAFLSFACYFLLLGLAVSLTCNCQLSAKLKRYQHHPQHPHQHNDEEPILPRHRQAAASASAEDDTTDPHGDLVVENQGDQDEESSSDPVIDETIDSLAEPLLKNRKKGKGSSKKAGTSGFAEHELI